MYTVRDSERKTQHAVNSCPVISPHLPFPSLPPRAVCLCVGFFLRLSRAADNPPPVSSRAHRASASRGLLSAPGIQQRPVEAFSCTRTVGRSTHTAHSLSVQDPRANARIFQVIARRCHVTSHVKPNRKPWRCCCCGLFVLSHEHRDGKVTLVESRMQ